MAKQSLPTNSMSILNFNVLVAGDNEGMLEEMKNFPVLRSYQNHIYLFQLFTSFPESNCKKREMGIFFNKCPLIYSVLLLVAVKEKRKT